MIASTQTNHPLVPAKAASSQAHLDLACTKLKSAGLRITQPRLAILAALIKAGQPCSIEAIHLELGTNSCDVVTVYRCMAAFEAIGLVRRAFLINGTSLYEISLGEPTRYHVVCKATKQVTAIDAEAASELSRALMRVEEALRLQGYSDLGHMVEFFGIAPTQRAQGEVPALTVPTRG